MGLISVASLLGLKYQFSWNGPHNPWREVAVRPHLLESLFRKRLFLPLHQANLRTTRAAQLSVPSIMWALNCSGPPWSGGA